MSMPGRAVVVPAAAPACGRSSWPCCRWPRECGSDPGRPATARAMRSAPTRWIVGSATPTSSMRWRTISRLCWIAASARSVMLASVGVTVITVSETAVTVISGAPMPNGPIGVASPRSSVIACSREAASRSVIVTTLLSRRTDCGWMRAWRSTRTASAFSVCTRSRWSAAASTSRTRFDPPRRSRPSVTCCLGNQFGSEASCSFVRRLGRAVIKPNRITPAYRKRSQGRVRIAFIRLWPLDFGWTSRSNRQAAEYGKRDGNPPRGG